MVSNWRTESVYKFDQAVELETEAYPLLDELTSKISTLNLECARRLKSKLVALTRRVQKVNGLLSFYFCLLHSLDSFFNNPSMFSPLRSEMR